MADYCKGGLLAFSQSATASSYILHSRRDKSTAAVARALGIRTAIYWYVDELTVVHKETSWKDQEIRLCVVLLW
jgi:hypothetical protein